MLLNQFTGNSQLVDQASQYYKPGDILLADTYQDASEAAFYLPGRPQTYIVNPQRQQPEYIFWLSTMSSVMPPANFS